MKNINYNNVGNKWSRQDSANGMNDIAENIKDIKVRIKNAALKVGKKPEEIKIVAVTKNVNPERMIMAVHEGLIDLGENRVQELLSKIEYINTSNKNVNWHMIGHVQRNKVKYLINNNISMIHSLDSIELAREIDKRSKNANKRINVLVQVNVGDEKTKYGVSVKDTMDFVEKLSNLEGIRVKGLMTIAPFSPEPEDVRLVFRRLKKIFIDISRENIDNIHMDYLSMGMSNDFEVAIEEGANIIRIGTALFGKRNYKNL